MSLHSCIPVVPSLDLGRSLRLWRDGLEFEVYHEMRKDGRLTLCMLRHGAIHFMLNERDGTDRASDDFEGIRLYWAPADLDALRRHLLSLGFAPTAIERRDYGQTEFFLTDDDGFTHCFGVPTEPAA